MAAVQMPLRQSLPSAQLLPSTHAVQLPPPQSMSVSLPFLAASLQVAARQMRLQVPLWQSPAAPQLTPFAHFLPCPSQVTPPQSTPVSVPFLTPSLQVGAWHVTLQTPFWQSLAAPQATPVPQVLPSPTQSTPPQSTPVSLPFLTPSLQV